MITSSLTAVGQYQNGKRSSNDTLSRTSRGSARRSTSGPAVKRCSICGEFKPLTKEHFFRRTDPKRAGEWHARCKLCRAKKQRELIADPAVRARRRKTMSKRWAVRMSDNNFSSAEKRRRADREAKRRQEPGVLIRTLQSVRRFRSTLEGRTNRLLWSTRSRCKIRGIEFDLTKEWIYSRLQAGRCEVSGIAFDIQDNGRRNPFSPSIDRKNPRRGYTADNCRLIVFSLNAAFGNWGEDAFLEIARAFVAAKSEPWQVTIRPSAEQA